MTECHNAIVSIITSLILSVSSCIRLSIGRNASTIILRIRTGRVSRINIGTGACTCRSMSSDPSMCMMMVARIKSGIIVSVCTLRSVSSCQQRVHNHLYFAFAKRLVRARPGRGVLLPVVAPACGCVDRSVGLHRADAGGVGAGAGRVPAPELAARGGGKPVLRHGRPRPHLRGAHSHRDTCPVAPTRTHTYVQTYMHTHMHSHIRRNK